MTSINYRPDIDGLRAIAVLSVVLYHLNEAILPGGFVGVDIFFVISGYLITKLIYKERVESGDFSYRNFYLRRVRRLFPALFATLLFSFILSTQLLSPAHLVEFCESLIAAIFSVSNLYFWNTAGYFDSDSSLKPLLHTWSLSVEEQFYFLWPFILVSLFAFAKRWVIPVFIVVMGLASLLLNVWFFSEQSTISAWFDVQDNQSALNIQSTAFYWLPFRVFEFSLGAILVWLKSPKLSRKSLLNETIYIAGLGLVIYSLVSLSSKIDFPSTAALLPCVGAALMIYSGPAHRLRWLSSNRVMVGIGLISYSLYLVHWPLIVFYKYWNFKAFGLPDYLLLSAVSLLLSWLMYRYIETPLRKPKASVAGRTPNKPFLLGALGLVLAVIGMSAHAVSSKGWLWRYPSDVLAQLQYKQGDYTEFFWKNITEIDGKSFAQDVGQPDKKKVLVIGDSMAADFINVLFAANQQAVVDLSALKVGNNCKGVFPLTNTEYRFLYAGAAELCQQEHKRLIQSPLLEQADLIVLATYWWELSRLHLIESTATYLREKTQAKVMVLGLKNQNSNGIWFLNKHSLSAQTHQIRTPLLAHASIVNDKIKAQAKNYDYISLLELFCDSHGCQRVTADGYVIVFDQEHLSEQGASFIAQRLESASWYSRFVQK